jgi:hypothetical protein
VTAALRTRILFPLGYFCTLVAVVGCCCTRPPTPTAVPTRPARSDGGAAGASVRPGPALTIDRDTLGSWTGVDRASGGGVIAVRGTDLVRVSSTGPDTVVGTLPDSGFVPSRAALDVDARDETVLWREKSGECIALDDDGTGLWRYPHGDSLAHRGVAVGDIDADGLDEIAFAGTGWVALLGPDGKERWRTPVGGWVAGVAIRSSADAAPVIVVSADDHLVLLDASGETTARAKPMDAIENVVSIPTGTGTSACFAAIGLGAGSSGDLVVGVDWLGNPRWRIATDEEPGQGPQVLAACPTRPYLAVGFGTGDIAVVATETGDVVARLTDEEPRNGIIGDMVWTTATEADGGTLWICTGARLRSYAVRWP